MTTNRRTHGGLYILLSLLIPAILTLLAYIALGIEPFGSKSLVLSDAKGYYMPYLSYCKTIFSGEHGLFYSFSQDIGGGIAATIWPYLLNPFSWIVALFQYEMYPTAYMIGVILVTALYGFSMYMLLKDINGHKTENLLISTVYAMSGFAVCFNINTAFFFGGPLCLPLMLLGLRKIFRRESPLLYILSIAYPVILQIQMGFAVCMAAFLLFLFKLIVEEHKGEIKGLWVRFISSSVVGGLLGAVIWLPEILIIRQGRGTFSLEDFVFSSNAPLLQVGARFFTGANSVNQIAYGFPAVFCGILPLALVVLFFLNKNINKKRKIAYIVLLTVYTLGFYIKTFTSVFQGFTHANWFNYRFSFVFIFILLLIASEQLNRLEEISKKNVKTAGISIFLFALIVFFTPYEFVDGGKVVLDLALLGIMGAAFFFHKKAPERAPKRVLVLFLCLCTFFQLYLNDYFCNKAVFNVWNDSGQEYADKITENDALITAVKATDDGFYRIASENGLAGSIGNDGLFLSYNGVGFAGHTERSFVSLGLGRLGLELSSGCWNSYDEGIPAATDDLLGVKYILSERDLTQEKGYTRKVNLLGLSLYENPFTLPIGFVSSGGIIDTTIADGKNVFENLNNLWKGITGDDRNIFTEETDISYSNHNPTDIYHVTHDEVMESADIGSPASEDTTAAGQEYGNIDSSAEQVETVAATGDSRSDDNRYKSYIEFSFKAKQTGPIYLYDYGPFVEGSGTREDIMQYVGNFKEGEDVTGKLYLYYEVTEQILIETVKNLHICYADQKLLQNYCEMINAQNSSIIKETDTHLTGDAEIAEGQRLFFTIPYDNGWTLTVDGETIQLDKTTDLFMSADVGAGRHHYELTFRPEGFNAGVAISVAALLLMIALCILSAKRRKNEEAATIQGKDNAMTSEGGVIDEQ